MTPMTAAGLARERGIATVPVPPVLLRASEAASAPTAITAAIKMLICTQPALVSSAAQMADGGPLQNRVCVAAGEVP